MSRRKRAPQAARVFLLCPSVLDPFSKGGQYIQTSQIRSRKENRAQDDPGAANAL